MDNMTHEYNQAEADKFAPEYERQIKEPLQKELQTLKDAVKQKIIVETDMFASVFKNDKERHEAERVLLKADETLYELIKEK